MRDNLQNVSFDRYLMRAKDIALLIGILFSWIGTGCVAGIYIVRMIDRITLIEKQLTEFRIELTEFKKGHVKG